MKRLKFLGSPSLKFTIFTMGFIGFLAAPLNSRGADTTFLPESHHQRYQTYGLFIDNQTTLIYRNAGRAWGALGATFALLGRGQGVEASQLVVSASVNTAFRLEDGLSPETADARVEITWDTRLSPEWLLSFGFSHASGHVNDSALPQDLDLLPLNLGVDAFPIRVIYDGSEFFRPGFTLKPLFESEPKSKFFQGNQFLEWYPWGRAKSYSVPTPYFAFGLEEYGHNSLEVSLHSQVGVYFGNHRDPKRFNSLRCTAGFYSGPDPRLKYYYYKDTHVTFGYLGIMLDI
ncbi:MAG: hypothetical protein H7301_05095 [Cryobacterium sp.]|nr:hypothetical protein [Oligoflexia bacterium]